MRYGIYYQQYLHERKDYPMKKMKYLRTWLVVALVVTIIGSLTGGTVAWFTDNVESANNVIQSGTLDIDIQLKDGDKWISLEKNPNTKVFDYNLWEPGYTQLETLKIVNKGNLALEYILNVQADNDEKTGPNGESLADAIEVYMCFGEPTTTTGFDTRAAFHAAKTAGADETVDAGMGWWYAGMLTDLMARETGFTQGYMLPSDKTAAENGSIIVTEDGTLMQGFAACTVALHMDEEAGNEYQNLSLGNVGFILKAKQFMYEEDSFDEKYDNEAKWPEDGDDPVISDLPKAKVRELTPDELSINCTDTVAGVAVASKIKFPVVSGSKELDFGLEFTAGDVIEGLEGVDYSEWIVDFELASTVGLSKTDPECHLTLAGHYGFEELAETGDWIGFDVTGVDITAGNFIRIMKQYDPNLTYEEVQSIGTFKCGVIVDKEYVAGKTLTLRLCMYNPNDPEGEPFVIKTIEKTF